MEKLIEFANFRWKNLGGFFAAKNYADRLHQSGGNSKIFDRNEKDAFVATMKAWTINYGYTPKMEFAESAFSYIRLRNFPKIVLLDEVTLPPNLHGIVITPANDDFLLFREHLGLLCSQYGLFLERCSSGFIDLEFVNSCIQNIDHKKNNIKSIHFERSKRPWSPIVVFEGEFDIFEDFIEMTSIVMPILSGEGIMFSKVKNCVHCNNFFIAKTARAIFCSNKCRYDSHMEHKDKGDE